MLLKVYFRATQKLNTHTSTNANFQFKFTEIMDNLHSKVCRSGNINQNTVIQKVEKIQKVWITPYTNWTKKGSFQSLHRQSETKIKSAIASCVSLFGKQICDTSIIF